MSVKSVDRIEVTREPQQATAATIALARLARKAAIMGAAVAPNRVFTIRACGDPAPA